MKQKTDKYGTVLISKMLWLEEDLAKDLTEHLNETGKTFTGFVKSLIRRELSNTRGK
jgi:DNA-binding MarR family transcriptional regulator